MAEGKLIIEVYEYSEEATTVPPFEYIPCALSECMGSRNRATLKEIIQKGFGTLSKKAQNAEKRVEVLQKLDEANIGRIEVVFNKASTGTEAYVELTNVVQMTFEGKDMTRLENHKDDIILHGRYRMTEGTETTKLRDAQRLTLIYSNSAEQGWTGGFAEEEESEVRKEICLNITYLQE